MHYLEYNEGKQHGTADFPVEYYHVDEKHSRYNMPFHWHREWELIRVLAGTLHLYLDDMEITAQTGDVILISEGTIHGGTPENCVYECLVFDLTPLLHTDTCRDYLRQITKHQIAVKAHYTKEDRSIIRVASHLMRSTRKKALGSELITMGSLYELFGILFQKHYYTRVQGKPGSSQKGIAVLKAVLEYIDRAYAGPVKLEDLSKIAGMSPKYFCRCFQAVIHRTPVDYLNYYRVERACLLFSTTDASVTEVAYQCGFNDSSYFVKAFKKYKGITPKQYSLHTAEKNR